MTGTAKSLDNFYIRLKENFGTKLVILLTSVYFFEQGVIYSMVYLNQLPLYKDVLKTTETQYQVFFLISTSPWSMKAFSGVVSDLFPLFGYHKTSYMIVTGFLGSVALSLLAVLNLENLNNYLAPGLIFVYMFELSVYDLLSEGHYSKILFEKKVEKADIITWVWICRVFGHLVGGSIVGTFVTYFHPRNVYWLCFALSFPTQFLLYAGFMGETYIPRWYKKFMVEKLKRQWKPITLALIVFSLSVGMIIVNILQMKTFVLLYSLLSSAFIICIGFYFLPTPLAKCNVYIFVQEAFYLRIMGALDYWYTAGNDCVAEGPHFGMTFYLTVTQLIGCAAGIVGILIFQRYTRRWTFRFAFMFSIFIRVFVSLFDLIIVTRTNIKHGISDRAMFIFGDAIAMDMAEMAAKMPAILLTARLVKKGLESTMYAILAIYHDFGKNVAISIGTTLMMYFRIDFDSRPCHYEMLPWLIVISHTILPMLAFPFAFLLIPDVKMSDTTAFDKYTVSETYGDVSRFDDTDSDIDNVVSGRANGDVGSDNDEGEMDETRGEDVGNSEDVGINGEIRERGEISLSGLSGNGDGSRNDRDY